MKRQAPAFVLALIMTFVLVCAAQFPTQTKICHNLIHKYFHFEIYGPTAYDSYNTMIQNKCDLTYIPVSTRNPRVAADPSQESCIMLQNAYLLRYQPSITSRNPSLHQQAEYALNNVINHGCDIDSLPMINPCPSYIKPTAHQLKCIGFLEKYFDAYDKFGRSTFGPNYGKVSIPFIDVKLNNCDTDRFVFVSPAPEIPNLYLDCSKLSENYLSAYKDLDKSFRYAPSYIGPLMPFMPSS